VEDDGGENKLLEGNKVQRELTGERAKFIKTYSCASFCTLNINYQFINNMGLGGCALATSFKSSLSINNRNFNTAPFPTKRGNQTEIYIEEE
jgi:hypothetical protein